MKKQNIFTLFLSLLKVKHTSNYSNKYFDEHPNKNNLLGISQMLSNYKIENIAFKVDPTKDSLKEIEPPFLVHVKDGFSLVTGLNNEQIELYIKEEKILLPIDNFIRMWSGVILVGEANEKSIEPEYTKNKKQELIGTFIKSCLSLSILIIIIKLVTISKFYNDWGLLTATLLNGIGIYMLFTSFETTEN
ncbi:MAG: hypothetical protein LUE98_14490 [Tannerellaceae bacterium]|nr:hypothetical protein [Tannerellaceae bacterium]